MSMRKQTEIRRGKVALNVYKGGLDDKIMVSFDKPLASRRVLGPLFTEQEFQDLAGLIAGLQEESTEPTAGAPRKENANPSYAAQLAQLEIQEAINAERQQHNDSGVEIVSPMPKFTRAHTCPQCGCHVQSTLRLGPTSLRMCPACERVHRVTR